MMERRSRFSLAAFLLTTFVFVAVPASADCPPGYQACDIYDEADLRAAVARNEGIALRLTLRQNITLTAPATLRRSVVVLLNGFNLTGQFSGTDGLGVVANRHYFTYFDGTIAPGGTLTTVGTTTANLSGLAGNFGGAGNPGMIRLGGDLPAVANAPMLTLFNGTGITALAPLTITRWTILDSPTDPAFFAEASDLPLPGQWDYTIDTNGFDVTFKGLMEGYHARLVKTGNGTLTITPPVPFQQALIPFEGHVLLTGGLLIRQGAVRASSNRGLGVLPDSYSCLPSTIFCPNGVAPLALDGGTLQAGASFVVARPTILESNGGTFDTNGYDLTLQGIEGPGGLKKIGAGNLILSSPARYQGSTAVDAGTLRLGVATALPAATSLTVATNAVVDASSYPIEVGSLSGLGKILLGDGGLRTGGNNASTTFAGSISGSGKITKTGTGTFGLLGNNTYTGGTLVESGTLSGTTESLRGPIQNDGVVIFDQIASGTFAETIAGKGSVGKTGNGTLSFLQPQLYTGNTTVSAGQLNIGGGLNGSIFIEAGGTLSGFGRIAGSAVINGVLKNGDLAPASALSAGESLEIGGDLLLNRSASYVTSLARPVTSLPRIGGQVVVDRATLTLSEVPAVVPRVITVPLFTAQGGATGGFGSVNVAAPLDAFLTARGSTVFVTLERTDVRFSSVATTDAGRATGAALDVARPSATGDLQSVIREIGALSDTASANALEMLAGRIHSNASRIGTLDSQRVVRFAADRLHDTGSGAWVRGLNGTTMRGTLAGFDRRFRHDVVAGAFGAYDVASMASAQSSADDRRARGGGYLGFTAKSFSFGSAVAVSRHSYQTRRHVVFTAMLDPALGGGPLLGGVDRAPNARFRGTDVSGLVDGGFICTIRGTTILPFAGLDWTRLDRDDFKETNAGAIGLVSPTASISSARMSTGVRVAHHFARTGAVQFSPRLEVRYAHELLDDFVPLSSTFADAPNTTFEVSGDPFGKHLISTTVGISGSFRHVTVSGDYQAHIETDRHSHTGLLTVAF